MNVVLINDLGESDVVKVGFSWTIFFFGSLGIPYFNRTIYLAGLLQLSYAIWCFNTPLSDILINPTLSDLICLFLSIPMCVLTLYYAFNGNEIYAKKLFKEGWKFHDPESSNVFVAKQKWGLNLDSK